MAITAAGRDGHYTAGYVIPTARLPEVQKALSRWPGMESDDAAPASTAPEFWLWHTKGGHTTLLLAANTEPAIDAMEAILADQMHAWALDVSEQATMFRIGHRYTHYAPINHPCWDRLTAMAQSRQRIDNELIVTIGRVTGVYIEHNWGEIVAYGPKVLGRATCLLVAPREAIEEMENIVAVMQADADFIEPGPPPGPLTDGSHRVKGFGVISNLNLSRSRK